LLRLGIARHLPPKVCLQQLSHVSSEVTMSGPQLFSNHARKSSNRADKGSGDTQEEDTQPGKATLATGEQAGRLFKYWSSELSS